VSRQTKRIRSLVLTLVAIAATNAAIAYGFGHDATVAGSLTIGSEKSGMPMLPDPPRPRGGIPMVPDVPRP
jgi:hypothetical protein